jgi:hypothetical protein
MKTTHSSLILVVEERRRSSTLSEKTDFSTSRFFKRSESISEEKQIYRRSYRKSTIKPLTVRPYLTFRKFDY